MSTQTADADSTVSNRFKACSTLIARGPMATADLAQLTGIDSGVLSKSAYAWRVKGLIERHTDGTYSITDACRAYVNGDTPSADAGLGQMFKERAAKKRRQRNPASVCEIKAVAQASESEAAADTQAEAQAIGITHWADDTFTLTVGEQHVSLNHADLAALRTLLQSLAL